MSLAKDTEIISDILSRDPNDPPPRDPDDVAGAINDLPDAVGESVSEAFAREKSKPLSVEYDEDGRIVTMKRLDPNDQETEEDNSEKVAEEDPSNQEEQNQKVDQNKTQEKEEEQDNTPPDQIEIAPDMLSEVLGVPSKDIVVEEDGIAIRAKVDGKVEEVSLKTLKDSYQLISTARQRLADVAEEKKEFTAKKKQTLEDLELQKNFFAQAITDLENQYVNDWQKVDWNRLRQEDPEQYTLLKQDQEERLKHLNVYKGGLIKAHEAHQKQIQKDREELLAEGARQLQNVFTGSDYARAPKWDKKEQTALSEWMIDNGFSSKEIAKTDSWLVFKWARDSMLREKERAMGKDAVKKVSKLPKLKVAKPGSRGISNTNKPTAKKGIEVARENQRKAAKINMSASGKRSNLNETVALIEQLLKPAKK